MKNETWQDALRKNDIKIGISTRDECPTLFDTVVIDLQKCSSYANKKAEFDAHLKDLEPGQLEGHSGIKKEQHLFYWTLGG